jgi:hypothetical protein
MTNKNCNLCGKGLAPGLVYFCRLCWFADVPPLDRQQLRQLHDRKHPVAAKVDSIVRRVQEKKARVAQEATAP